MTGNNLWEDYKQKGKIIDVEFAEKECPLCGDRGYTVESFGDDIEYQGCLCRNQKGKDNGRK
jgi:hypothetical protein|tara:strand:- start:482 stop:667 length:186 start_codon:yes stop_codon:yes gene_type:complete